jgi:hypothetical protein
MLNTKIKCKGREPKPPFYNLRVYDRIFIEELSKITKHLRHCRLSLGPDLKSRLPECGVLTIRPRFWVVVCFNKVGDLDAHFLR